MADTNQNVTQTVTSTSELPAWYKDFLTNVIGQAQNVAATPYQAYEGPRVAGLTQDQTDAYQRIRDLQGAASPLLGQAAGMYGNLGAGDTLGSIGSYLDAAKGAGQSEYGQAEGLLGQSAAKDTASQYTPYGQAASSLGYGAGAAASPYIQASANPTGLSAASPYLNAASGSFPQAAASYMSPYTDSVVNRISQLGARNLQENLLPAIGDNFIKSGQFGSTRQNDIVGRAIRDTQESVLGQQAQALQAGYGQAGQLYESDAARQAALAGTAGGLGTAQQQALLGAGNSLGSLGLNQAGLINQVGQFGTQASAADAARQLQAGQGLASIGQANQAQTLGLAGLASNATQADLMRQMQGQLYGAQGLTGLATTGNALTLQNSAAQEAAGRAEQSQGQTSLDTAYQDFLNQRAYPGQQVATLSNVVHGLPVNTSSSGTTTGPATAGQLQPSALAGIAGLGLGIAGLSNSGLFKARGGAVRRMATGGPVRGIGSFKRAA